MKKTNQREEVIIKKVRAFPIAGQIKTSDGAVIPAQIVKLTMRGFLAEIVSVPVKPGEKFEVDFEFPVLHTRVLAPVVVVKLYQQWGPNTAVGAPLPPEKDEKKPAEKQPEPVASTTSISSLLIEMHFQSLSEDSRRNIDTFLAQLQKRSS